MSVITSTRPASLSQTRFLRALLAERRLDDAHTEKYLDLIETGQMTLPFASKTIEWLRKQPYRYDTPAELLVTEEGMYRFDGVIYKVQRSRSTRHLYAKRLHGDTTTEWHFTYAGSPNRLGLTAAHRMTLEEAAAWGAQFGTCCVCAATLTNPESIAAGIGPVCATRI